MSSDENDIILSCYLYEIKTLFVKKEFDKMDRLIDNCNYKKDVVVDFLNNLKEKDGK